jgi:hypothetical protein
MMWIRTAFLFPLVILLFFSAPTQAGTGDLTLVIEQFVVAQFPASKSHFWVVNDTHWQTDNEVVVDVNTVVLKRLGETPTANRYLLLIVGNKLAASQNIPLDTAVDCQPEQA